MVLSMFMVCCCLSGGGSTPDPRPVPAGFHSSRQTHFRPHSVLCCLSHGIPNHLVPQTQELLLPATHPPSLNSPIMQVIRHLILCHKYFPDPCPPSFLSFPHCPSPGFVRHLLHCRSLPVVLLRLVSFHHSSSSLLPSVLSKPTCSHLLSCLKSPAASSCFQMNFK